MRVCGVIAEYNPFHNGHALHLAKTRALTGCDALVVALSGACTQRGELALLDTATRAEMALQCGADLVVALPALFATQPADGFAWGGVSLLEGLGVLDALSFGTELPDLPLLTRMARLRDDEPKALALRVKANLAAGQSHARARGEALSQYLAMDGAQLNAPNAQLAVEYLRALNRAGSAALPVAIERAGGYHDPAMGEMASASAIRAAIGRGEWAKVKRAMPERAFRLLEAQADALPNTRVFDALMLDKWRRLTTAALDALPDAGEGLPRRVKKYADDATTREALIEAVKCKRYTHARISRLLLYGLLDIDRALTDACRSGAPYVRVLGFRERARPLLRRIRVEARIPIDPPNAFLRESKVFALESRATDLWQLVSGRPANRVAGRAWTTPVVRVADAEAAARDEGAGCFGI